MNLENRVQKLEELVKKLSDNNDECNCCGWDDCGYTHEPGCNLKKALSDKEKNERKYFECSEHRTAGWGECSECNQKTSEPKQEECTCTYSFGTSCKKCKDECTVHGEDKPKQKCVKENGYFACYCGKCEPDDYPLPKDFLKQSTSLKEEIYSKIIDYSYQETTTEETVNEILKLIQSHLVKEVQKQEMPGYQDEGAEHAHAGYVRALEDIIKIINALK